MGAIIRWPLGRRVLIQAYASTGISIWDCSSLDWWHEIVNLPTIKSAFAQSDPSASSPYPRSRQSSSASLADRFPQGIGRVIGAKIVPSPVAAPSAELGPATTDDIWAASRPLLAIATQRTEIDELGMADSVETSQLLLYSLKSHSIVHTIDFAGKAGQVQANARFVVVSTSSPLALHVLSATTLHPTPFSPLTELAPNPFDSSPVFDLGSGGRLLAFATDRPLHASRLDRHSAKPGAGIVAERGMFDSNNFDDDEHDQDGDGGAHFGLDARTAGQVGGEVARRVGEGMLSGVKAIGGIGMSYWASRGTNPPSVESTSPVQSRQQLSKSAPVPSGFDARRLSVSSASPRTQFSPMAAAEATVAGTVLVVDLASYTVSSTTKSRRRAHSNSNSLKAVAHFRPYSHHLALVSLAASSAQVLTASAHGHHFDVFDLKPSVRVGSSATGASNADGPGRVWHRYRLHRGFTGARASGASWSADSRFVAVATGKGTSHLYAIEPFGGQPDLQNHFGAKVVNPSDLRPLSVTLGTVARIRRGHAHDASQHAQSPSPDAATSADSRPSLQARPSGEYAAAPPVLTFISHIDTAASSFKPILSKVASPVVRPLRSPGLVPAALPGSISAGSGLRLQDCLIFRPTSATAVLARLTSGLPPAAATAASRGDVGRLATTAISGLSQLMKSQGGSAPSSPGKSEFVVSCIGKAEWPLGRDADGGQLVQEDLIGEDDVSIKPGLGLTTGTTHYAAQAEVRTQSSSGLVMPRSVYQTQQFDFYALPENHEQLTAAGNFSLGLRKLQVRKEVKISEGSSSLGLLSSPSSPFANLPSADPLVGSFDQPIQSAMQTILDHQDPTSPRPNSRAMAPTFPNGVAGKQGTWRDSIPIRHVAPTVQEGLGRVRREIGRVAESRRRARSAATDRPELSSAGEGCSSSVSFDDDEAVFADRGELEGSESTEGTSEGWDEGEVPEEGGGAKAGGGEGAESRGSPVVSGEGATGFFEEGEVDLWDCEIGGEKA